LALPYSQIDDAERERPDAVFADMSKKQREEKAKGQKGSVKQGNKTRVV
jgi:hypothetical protein